MWINWWFLIFVTAVAAVKDYTFKNCEQAGFCHRNRKFAHNVRSHLDSYVPQYRVNRASIELIDTATEHSVSGIITKQLPSEKTVTLPFKVSVVQGNNVRFTLDEQRDDTAHVGSVYAKTRYNESSIWAFQSNELPKDIEASSTVGESGVEIQFGDDKYSVKLQYFPVKISVLYKGEVQLVVNEDNLLNIEHLRSRTDSDADHLSPEESNYDMFQDSFESSKDDKLPFGPESIGLDFTFKGFGHLYGIPEHADSLSLKHTIGSLPYRLYNVDIFEYETNSRMSMYGTIPLLVAVKPELSVGIFWINSADTFIDLDKSDSRQSKAHWISENGILDFMIIIDKTPAAINKNYGLITGYTQLPPLFSLGYHQCRWNYNDEDDVLDISAKFDEHQIPYDTIWLDIEYADAKKYFTWQNEKFPSPQRMLAELDHTGRNLVIIVDPHIKTGYSVSDALVSKQITINNPANSTYYGHCWPGESVWVDSMNPNSQAFWDSKFEWSDSNHFMGGKSSNIFLWNDMNEPSVFNGPEDSSPRDNLHYGGWEHRSVHNVFGLTFHESTYNSLMKRQVGNTNRERPFVLTRAYYAGSQRTAAMWTGDNMSKWEYLKVSIPMVLTSGMVGMPYAGADVGGFFGNPSKELLTRWYQTGIWYPFFRAHAHIDSRRREPWVAGEPYTSIMRDTIRLRYKLLPVLYTAFFESSQNGIPVMKPIFYETLGNLDSYEIDDQFFVGNSGIMVKPVTEEGASKVDVYIPSTDIYYDYTNGEFNGQVHKYDKPRVVTKKVSLHDIPMFLKGGSILSLKDRYRRSTRQMARDPYTIIVALDTDYRATGTLYIDDGESFDYVNSDKYVIVGIEAEKNTIVGTAATSNDDYIGQLDGIKVERIVVVSPTKYTVKSVTIEQDGRKWNAAFETQDSKLLIKRPQLCINKDWKVTLEENELEHDEL